jgi:hypothetical protein
MSSGEAARMPPVLRRKVAREKVGCPCCSDILLFICISLHDWRYVIGLNEVAVGDVPGQRLVVFMDWKLTACRVPTKVLSMPVNHV